MNVEKLYRIAMLAALTSVAAGPGGEGFRPGPLRPATRSAPPLAGVYQDTETHTIHADRDTWVSNEKPDDNFGGDSRLYVGQRPGYGAARSLIHFDLGDLDDDEVVTDGELKLRLQAAGPSNDPGRDIVVRRVTSKWSEGEPTWNHFPSWSDERISSVSIGRSSGWYAWDVGKLVRKWYQDDWDNRGIYVQGYEADGSYRAFASSESSDEPALDLEVVIDKVPPVATMKPLPPFVNTPSFLLEWNEGVDPDPGTGVAFYRLYGMRNDGPWLKIDGDIEALSGTFYDAEDGTRYSFRVDAVDFAGNQEPPGAAEATTVVDLSPPRTTMQPLPEFTPGPIVLQWSGVDLPNFAGQLSSGIASYDLQYRGPGGDWADLAHGIQQTSFRIETPVQGALYEFRVRGVDRAGNVEPFAGPMASTTPDALPPVVWFDSVSGIDSPTFTVRWNAIDPGGSGVVNVDVQYRVDEGPWQDWVVRTTDRSKQFSGELGHVYTFRARGRDVAGNVGNYPAQKQLTVLVIASSDLTEQIYLPENSGSGTPGQPPGR